MNRLGAFLLLMVLALLAFAMNGCGDDRVLQSITIAPAVANAQDYPNGQVLFTASGMFNKSPTRVDALTVQWQLPVAPLACPAPMCSGPIAPTVQVTCAGVQSGTTAEVIAVAPRNPNMPAGSQGVPTVTAKAQLICP